MNAANSSYYIRQHLLARRTTVLFAKVFEILAPRYETQASESYDNENSNAVNAESKSRAWEYPR